MILWISCDIGPNGNETIIFVVVSTMTLPRIPECEKGPLTLQCFDLASTDHLWLQVSEPVWPDND